MKSMPTWTGSVTRIIIRVLGFGFPAQNQHWEGRQIPAADDYTSVAFWYQAHPTPELSLSPYRERVAPSQAKNRGSHQKPR